MLPLRRRLVDWLAQRVSNRLRTVNPMEVDSLQHLLQQAAADVLLLDIRTPEEFEASHLPGAIHAQSPTEVVELLKQHPGAVAVVYCSLGVRSGFFIQSLVTASPPHLYNLQGGIFAWALHGYPVFDIHGQTSVVHGYGRPWKYLLPRSRRL